LEQQILSQVLLLLGLSVAMIAALRRLHLPPMLGYLAVGIAVGPHALGWLPEGPGLDLLAEIGLAFLLFMLGLEFSLSQLLAMRGPILGLGGAQVAISTISGAAIAMMMGMAPSMAWVLGGAMALSSTAIGVRELTERMESHQQYGRLALGILLFQDLAAIPLLAVIPTLSLLGEGPTGLALTGAIAKGVIAVLAVYATGHWLLRPLFHWVAAARSNELFTLTALFAALAAAGIGHLFGLSLALGAFLAGVMLGESAYRHQIESDMRPFRDVLMGLFFIHVGIQLDVRVIPQIWPWLLLLVPGLILGKGLLIALLTGMAGHRPQVALRTGILLGQGGEFGLAVLIVAIQSGIVTHADGQPILAAIILSMAISPFLIRCDSALIAWLFPKDLEPPPRQQGREPAYTQGQPPANHVLLCGFGHVGQNLATFLRGAGQRYAALEIDPIIVQQCREAGENVFYGDSSSPELLKAAGVEQAAALAISFDDPPAAEKIVRWARGIRPDLPIIVRLRDDSRFQSLQQAGATDIVPEYVEAGTTLATSVLGYLHVPTERLLGLVEQTRHDKYRKLRGVFGGEESDGLEEHDAPRLKTVLLNSNSRAVGKRLGELPIPQDIRIEALRRGAVREEPPNPRTVLQSDDVLVLQGPLESLKKAKRKLLWGG